MVYTICYNWTFLWISTSIKSFCDEISFECLPYRSCRCFWRKQTDFSGRQIILKKSPSHLLFFFQKRKPGKKRRKLKKLHSQTHSEFSYFDNLHANRAWATLSCDDFFESDSLVNGFLFPWYRFFHRLPLFATYMALLQNCNYRR